MTTDVTRIRKYVSLFLSKWLFLFLLFIANPTKRFSSLTHKLLFAIKLDRFLVNAFFYVASSQAFKLNSINLKTKKENFGRNYSLNSFHSQVMFRSWIRFEPLPNKEAPAFAKSFLSDSTFFHSVYFACTHTHTHSHVNTTTQI